jgi:hypothetical protein
MNNTKTRTLAIVAVLTAATLVAGVTFAATTTHSAVAYKKRGDDKKDKERDNGNHNGNTVTVQVNKEKASQSGHDNTQEQEAENVICTHPEEDATCLNEG